MIFLRQAAAMAAKDIRTEVRSRYALSAILPFATTLLIAFGLSLGPGRALLQQAAPGLLWMAIFFAAVLAFRRSYDAETEDGALEGLLLAPVDRAAIFVGKAAAVTVELVVLEAIVALLAIVLFDISLGSAPAVAAAFILGTLGLAAVGSLFGLLAESNRAREAIFPLLVLPLATPVLVAAVRATSMAGSGRAGEGAQWFSLLLAFDLVFLTAGTLVFGYLLED